MQKQNKKPAEYDFPIITGHKFNPEDNTYTIELSTILYDLLLEYMEVGYTPLNLNVLLGLNNFYAQRIYELLRLWSGRKESINYTIDYLRECFGLGDKYPRYNNFKERVIDPALESLNGTEKFKITYEELKSGRRVDSITFTVEDLDKRKYFDKEDSIRREVIKCKENGNNRGLEQLNEEKSINSRYNKSESLKIENEKIYIPDETIFTKGTLRSFKKDFINIDFKDTYMEKAFDDAVMITLDKDDVETIKASSYKFFKGTLENKIIEYEKEKETDIKHKEEMDMFW
ncbi:replication initiation protein [Paraclostridium sp. AKS46]|nr:replication initiation protein [Paraclostridium sp. AKS46]